MRASLTQPALIGGLVMGVLSALAGVIFAGRLNQAGPTAGTSFELDEQHPVVNLALEGIIRTRNAE